MQRFFHYCLSSVMGGFFLGMVPWAVACGDTMSLRGATMVGLVGWAVTSLLFLIYIIWSEQGKVITRAAKEWFGPAKPEDRLVVFAWRMYLLVSIALIGACMALLHRDMGTSVLWTAGSSIGFLAALSLMPRQLARIGASRVDPPASMY
jgi:hypothetical protein